MNPGVVGVERVVRYHRGGLDVGVRVVEGQKAAVNDVAEQVM
jgi:hypothetical protein